MHRQHEVHMKTGSIQDEHAARHGTFPDSAWQRNCGLRLPPVAG
jgi:hypothetical protein